MLRVYIGTYNFAFTEIFDKEVRRIPFLSASDIHSHDFFFLFPLSSPPPLRSVYLRKEEGHGPCMHKEGKKEEEEEKGGEDREEEEFVRGTKRNNLLSSRPKERKLGKRVSI